jgi:hypothetical protein
MANEDQTVEDVPGNQPVQPAQPGFNLDLEGFYRNYQKRIVRQKKAAKAGAEKTGTDGEAEVY